MAEQSLNRYEAERFNDHCLPSTVSTIQQKHGITIARRFETVPGYMGIPTSCCRYWLEPEQKVKAMEILLKKGSKDRETSAYASSGT
ncbi:hypothetical protein F3F93_12250 [Mariprofundus sp. KV]|nr:hypothetical protein [Mariprofundus sp. KV]